MSLLDGLVFVTENAPAWIARLDELTQQIICRHSELNQLSVRQLKPKNGSTESLRPRTNAEGEIPPGSEPAPALVAGMRQHYAGNPLRRKRKTETISSSMEPTKYRTRSMIIVYYDSAVQEAFEGIVRSISTARNNIRKGRMAARMKAVTSIPEGLLGEDASGIAAKLNLSKMGRSRGGGAEAKNVLDTIDEGLEGSQSLCEHGAHQFLRDGDCSTEIEGIKKKLTEVTALAKQECERLSEAEAEAKRAQEEQMRREEELERMELAGSIQPEPEGKPSWEASGRNENEAAAPRTVRVGADSAY